LIFYEAVIFLLIMPVRAADVKRERKAVRQK